MARRLKINHRAFARATIQSDAVRELVAAKADEIADRARGLTDDEIVTADAGRSRARSYVRRLGSGARGEADDGALSRSVT